MFLRTFLLVFILFIPFLEAKPPALDAGKVKAKMEEIMKAHASQKEMNPTLMKRAFVNFLEEMDPTKTYFIEGDIKTWLDPSDSLVQQSIDEYKKGQFDAFNQMYEKMLMAIKRRDELEKKINDESVPKHVDAKKFKDLKWATSEEDLLTRLKEVKSLQIEASMKLNAELRDKAIARLENRRKKYEKEFEISDPALKQQQILSYALKAFASSLDTHTAYFTPEEAQQFMINVQQRLFGIGAQLRDDINGFTVTKIVEGGPAAKNGQLKLDDRIVAVDGEPVVGMNIVDAVNLIRGEKNTPVRLTVIREQKDGEKAVSETLDLVLLRGEVVLTETRYETRVEPYGNGVIAYLRLFSFYQDPEHSSAQDLANELKRLKKEYNVEGVVLDLRNNSGGLLTQAVAVAGLFISKGVVVSIKDDQGSVQHLRDLDGTAAWNGPLIVLINRLSASASEIVAQALKDYGRAIIVGDDHSFGKGSFQTFTLNTSENAAVNPEGEYKVTRGRYYTVSGKSPQLVGVASDVVVPGPFSESEVGEKFAKYPLETDEIKPQFDDDLSDLPPLQRAKISALYKFDLQPKLTIYQPYLETLVKNSALRIKNSKDYQQFLEELKKQNAEVDEEEPVESGKTDLQLLEAMNLMKDLILLMEFKPIEVPKSDAIPAVAA